MLGEANRNDNNRHQGEKSATFTTTIIDEGEYEVRLLHVATNNRVTNATVTIHAEDGDHAVAINQRAEYILDGVPRALGIFKFAAGKEAKVTITNGDADGFLVVDGLQIVPLAIAKAERAGARTSGFALRPKEAKEANDEKSVRNPMIAVVALSPLAKKTTKTVRKSDMEEIHLARDAQAADVNGSTTISSWSAERRAACRARSRRRTRGCPCCFCSTIGTSAAC